MTTTTVSVALQGGENTGAIVNKVGSPRDLLATVAADYAAFLAISGMAAAIAGVTGGTTAATLVTTDINAAIASLPTTGDITVSMDEATVTTKNKLTALVRVALNYLRPNTPT